MLTENVIALLQSGYTTIDVVFSLKDKTSSDKLYTYKVLLSDSIEVGCTVVVPTRDYFQLSTVVAVHTTPKIDKEAAYPYRFIVQKVDFTSYNSLKSKEEEMQLILKTAELQAEADRAREVLRARYGDDVINQLKSIGGLLTLE